MIGVVENMSSLPCPHCGEPIDLFGSGGGALVSEVLTRELGTEVPVLARIPFDLDLRSGGDDGSPAGAARSASAGSKAITELAGNWFPPPEGWPGCRWV